MRRPIIAATLILTAPAAASGQERAEARPQALGSVLDCRAVAAVEERLACFDRTVAALAQAESARELVVMDRQQLRRTRRSLFGLSLPDLNLFGDGNEDAEAVTQVDGTIRTATQDALGKWILTLEDGARWHQIDSRELNIDPRPGHQVRIRRAAMGSYLANVNNQVAIRVRRDR